MKKGKCVGLLTFLCFSISFSSIASHSGAFLRIGVGARALGMGGAFVALADDATAIYWNPAGLTYLKSGEFTSMYTDQFGLGTRFSFVAYAQPLGENKGLAIGVMHLSLGQIPITDLDENGRPIVVEYTESSDTSLLLAYAQTLFKASLGLTIKGIHQVLAGESSWGFGIDLGSKIPLFGSFSLGAAVRTGFANWSTGERATFPSQMILGVAYLSPNLIIVFDTSFQSDRGIEIHSGGEYWPIPQMALRMGLDRGKPTMGTGFVIGGFKLDYALLFHELGLCHRFSFGMEF